ncbi:MAG: redoxin domain-containing protein [Clostridia bacterium]|nr:redoxin domain-containing protein [Clostridia bacterium]
MKRSRKLLSLLLALCLLAGALIALTACGGDDTESSLPSSGTSTTESSRPDSSTTESSTSKPSVPGDQDVPKTNYTVEVLTEKTDKPLVGVDIFIYDEEGYIVGQGKTDENGLATISAPRDGALEVELGNVPKGYKYDEYYELKSNSLQIVVKMEVMENEDGLNGVQYALGDMMYDFTMVTVDGRTVKLSQLLKEKRAVVLNFWYTTCTYCIEEFPYLQSAYEKYSEQIELIGVNAYSEDNVDAVRNFVENFAKPGVYTADGCELTFPMVMDEIGLQDAFGFQVNPCTVIIDRYGMVSLIQTGGVMGERYFTNAFDHFVADEYEQKLFSSIYELSPLEKPDIEMPSSDEIKDVVFSDADVQVTFRPEDNEEDAEYTWPFIITEKDGEACIKSSNFDKDNSWATLYMDITLEAGQAFMFDYYASTERLYDVLYVLVDGKDIYSISGMPLQTDDGLLLEEPWKSCCSWVAKESGTYEVSFCYIKNESEMEGEDTVYLKNFRVVSENEVDVETYIPRFVATELQENNDYKNYEKVFYNEIDGYYHVGSVDGPLLLAGLINLNIPFVQKLPEGNRFTVSDKLTTDEEFYISSTGEDKYIPFIKYCNYASNSRLLGFCPVTEELKGYLMEFVKQNDFITNENTWLQLCSYYDAYGTDSELADPIKGLAQFSAYETVVTEEGDENGFKNSVTYYQVVMPRGYLYKFVPTKSGVYRITSKSSQEVNGWVYTGTYEQWMYETNGDRIEYTNSDVGERYCPELLVDPEGDGTYVRDFTNCSMIAYFEQGVEYYISIAYYDVYATGTFTFDVKYVGDSFDVFKEASPGFFTFEEAVMDTIAGGINVKLCTDENDPRYGYYCHLLPNGELGSIIYADFHYTTNTFPSQSLKQLIEQGAFDMGKTELDHDAYAYFKNYYEKGGVNALRTLWGDNFDTNWEFYKMADVIKGIYHGTGPDYTEAMRAYIAKIETGLGEDGETFVNPERQGCVPVDAELAVMLQAIMDKFTFKDVDHSWTKLCYYYQSNEALPTVDSWYAEMKEMVDNNEIKNEEIAQEIADIVEEVDESLTKTTNKYVALRLIDGAMERIYVLIEADKAN